MLFVNHRSAAGADKDNLSSDRPDDAKRQHTGMGQPDHAAAAPSAISCAGATPAAVAAAAASSSNAPRPSSSASTHEPIDYPEHDGVAPMIMVSDDDK